MHRHMHIQVHHMHAYIHIHTNTHTHTQARPRVREISMLELHDKRMANPKVVILDVREDHEADNLPIPAWFKPVRIGRGVLERNVKEKIPDLNAEIVIICAGGMRSLKAAETMQIMGYTNVFSLSDGVGAVVAGHKTAQHGVQKGFVESVGNTPLIRLNRCVL